jgi:two-component system, OmpR family, response regulator QseB
MAYLVVEKNSSGESGKTFTLGKDVVVLGRATPGGSADIVLHDDYVSKKHAEIRCEGNHFAVIDTNSKNGTQVEGRKIQPGIAHSLKHNSTIGIGIVSGRPRIVLRFKESDDTKVEEPEQQDQAGASSWIKVDEDRGEIWVEDTLLALSRKEYELMLLLYKNSDRICSRDMIIAAVWPEVEDPGAVSDATIDQMIYRLRKRIETDRNNPRRIVSKKGFGFILVRQ